MKKIAIVGPECTGKSALSIKLANYFNCSFIPEIAREYLSEIKQNYEEIDLLKIAKLQCKAENEGILKSGDYLFCDTTLTVIKIWSKVKYNRCDSWILDEDKNRKYDFYLITNIDLPWEDDALREHSAIHVREKLLEMYIYEITNKNTPFGIVSGIGLDRLNNALKILSESKIVDIKANE